MKRFEELMNIPKNNERFLFLEESLKCNRLICFFGAGLSLGEKSKEWGYPFKWTIEQLNNYIGEIKNDMERHNGVSIDDELQEIIDKIFHANECCKKDMFLEAGDLLGEAISLLIPKLHHRALNIEFDSINKACVSSFENDTYSKADENFASPYIIPSIFYLPFLSKHLITTNVERSFERVVNRLNQDRWHRNVITPLSQVVEWQDDLYSIFYIHGHISQPNTLVMAKESYDKMYPETINAYNKKHGARKLLGAAVRGYSILFVGASLQKDRTVDVINFETEHKESDSIYLIPIVSENSNGEIDKLPQISEQEPIRYCLGKYEEVAIILLQLIRNTTKTWEYCSWQNTTHNGNEALVPEEVKSRICNSLTNDRILDQIDITNSIEINDLIHYLYSHHSVACHDSGLGWSICSISQNEFSLDGTFPLHNYPLGDTIYVLAGGESDNYGDSPLYRDRANIIAEEIKTWREHFFPYFFNKEGLVEIEAFSPRVRIIKPTLPLSRWELEHEQKMKEEKQLIEMTNQLLNYINIEENTNISYQQLKKLFELINQWRMFVQVKEQNINNKIVPSISLTLTLPTERGN